LVPPPEAKPVLLHKRADARSRVKGIVHDASGSGQTLFVEPLVAVELGNAWREAQLAEAAEVERILDELSALVGSQADPLRETLDALARFDFWSAKARLAEELDAVRAETAPRTEIVLRGARHPGLTGTPTEPGSSGTPLRPHRTARRAIASKPELEVGVVRTCRPDRGAGQPDRRLPPGSPEVSASCCQCPASTPPERSCR
jgi:hypothetical protein